jgi:hypothetical protein
MTRKKRDKEPKPTDDEPDERARRFMWEPGDVTYTPPTPEPKPEQIPPRRRK